MKTVLKVIIPLLLLGFAFGIAKALIASKPPLESKQPPAVVPTVPTIQIKLGSHSPPIRSFGTVQSYFEANLTPQVTGTITAVSEGFRVGNQISKGSTLVQIDTTDYEAILARESANLTINQRTLEEEIILAKQAEQDWIASGRKLDTASPFVLRKPQLAAAKASITSTQAAIKKAQTDIDRCTIKAPFDAIVSTRSASLGNFATPQATLGSLIATEKSEIRLPLTPEQSSRILLPNSSVEPRKISLTSPTQPTAKWEASLRRTEPVIDPQNQVVFVIAEIDHPYDQTSPLPVGTFVNASIPANQLTDAFEIPESALVNDSFLWALNKDETLYKVAVQRIHSHHGKVYVKSTEEQSATSLQIVTRPLTNFRTGMKVIPQP